MLGKKVNSSLESLEKFSDTKVKLNKSVKPHRLVVCESGMYACLACCDANFRSGQFFMLYLSQKKVNVKLIKQVTQPVTSVCF